MVKVFIILVLVLQIVVFAHTFRVYENEGEEEEPVDVSGNVNSTGPVVYPSANNTQDIPMMRNETREINSTDINRQATLAPDRTPANETTNARPEANQRNVTNATIPRSNSNNQTSPIPAKVKESSSAKPRRTPLNQPTTKSFIPSPKDVATRMAQGGPSFAEDSFQPMFETDFRPSALLQRRPAHNPVKHHYQTPPRPPPEEPVHQNSARDLVYREPQHQGPDFKPTHHYIEKRPVPKEPPPIDYSSFQKNFFPSESHFKEHQPKFNSLQEYIQHTPRPTPDNSYVMWPESQNNETPNPQNAWTTEQPEFETHPPYKYYPPPTEYSPPKGFLSSALSMITQSLKPSIPTRPYPFELTETPKHYYEANSGFRHFPPSGHGNDPADHKHFEKYEIITTSPPEYQFQTKFPHTSALHHETEVARPPHRHNLPWHKIIKVLSAIVPFGLLVSALTPNVVLINPNATSPKPVGNIYSYVTRQRSLEPDHVFDQKIMEIFNGLDGEDAESLCIKIAICKAIADNKPENLTQDEYAAFQTKLCDGLEDIPGECPNQ